MSLGVTAHSMPHSLKTASLAAVSGKCMGLALVSSGHLPGGVNTRQFFAESALNFAQVISGL